MYDIFTYIWLNVGKYTIHGWYGREWDVSSKMRRCPFTMEWLCSTEEMLRIQKKDIESQRLYKILFLSWSFQLLDRDFKGVSCTSHHLWTKLTPPIIFCIPFQQHPVQNKNGTHPTQPCVPPTPFHRIHPPCRCWKWALLPKFVRNCRPLPCRLAWAKAGTPCGLVVTRRDSQQTKPPGFFVEETAFGKRKAKIYAPKTTQPNGEMVFCFVFENLGNLPMK